MSWNAVLQVAITSPTTSKTYVFQADQWVEPADNLDDPSTWTILQAMARRAEGHAIAYVVKVHTSKGFGSGTDAKVYLSMRGLAGSSGPKLLDSTKGKHFKGGSTDEFIVNAPDVGDIDQVLIAHDGAGLGSSWHLDRVRQQHCDHISASLRWALHRQCLMQ